MGSALACLSRAVQQATPALTPAANSNNHNTAAAVRISAEAVPARLLVAGGAVGHPVQLVLEAASVAQLVKGGGGGVAAPRLEVLSQPVLEGLQGGWGVGGGVGMVCACVWEGGLWGCGGQHRGMVVPAGAGRQCGRTAEGWLQEA